MIQLFLALAWGTVLIFSVFKATAPQPANLDLRRCYAEHQLTYWDGPDGMRQTPSTYRAHVYCWPKDGCWLATNGDAICWRVVNLKAK